MELSTCCDVERWLDLESDICSSCKEHADFIDDVETCSRCDFELEPLDGHSTHQSRWYCPNCCDDAIPNQRS